MHSLILLIVFVLISKFPSLVYIIFPVTIFLFLLNSDLKFKVGNTSNGWFLLILLSILFSVNENLNVEAVKGFFRYISYLLLFLIYFRSKMRFNIGQVFNSIIFFAIILSFFESFYLLETIGGLKRYAFVFQHPNHMAYFFLPILFYFLFSTRERNIYGYCSLASCFLVLLISKSSGPLIVSCLLVLYRFRREILTPKVIFLTLFSCVILFKLGVLDKVSTQFDFLYDGSVQNLISEGNLGGDGSLAWRLVYWSLILKHFFALNLSDYIFGLGTNTLSYGNYIFHFMYTDPHNDFIKILVENGILLFLVFLTILLKSILMLKSNRLGFFILIFTPMMVGNIIVNGSFFLVLILVLIHFKEEVSYQ
ncbi:hypothetical protein LOS73_18735 [Pseudoalteromonas sp. SCSIO 43210]